MLNEWFSLLPKYDHNAGNLSSILEECQQESLTGLLRFSNHSDDLLLWTFVNGQGKALFEYSYESWLTVPQSQWLTRLEENQINIFRSPVPLPGMRVCEIVLTAGFTQANSGISKGKDLLRQLQFWFQEPCPGVVHIQGDHHELFCVLFGDGVSNMEVLSFTGGESVFSVEQPDDLPVQDHKEYKTSFYTGFPDQDVWNKSRLRLAFGALVRLMIQRFGYMVGFVLADRLSAQLTQVNRARGIDIKITSNGIDNNQLFQSSQQACEVYSLLLNDFFERTSVLIGARMSKEIAMTMLEKLHPTQRELLVSRLRELRGPQFIVAGF